MHSAAGLAKGYRLDGRVSLPGRNKSVSLLHSMQTNSAYHLAPYPFRARDTFTGSKAAGQ
jgi:hypothetical protein